MLKGPNTPNNGHGDDSPISMILLREVVNKALMKSKQGMPLAVKGSINRTALRKWIAESGAIGFIANGSILPRASGGSDMPPDTSTGTGVVVVPFKSPPSLEVAFSPPCELPSTSTKTKGNHNSKLGTETTKTETAIRGMLIKEGITVIAGGGYQEENHVITSFSEWTSQSSRRWARVCCNGR